MKKIIILCAAGMIIIALCALAPWAVGLEAEKLFKQQTQNFSAQLGHRTRVVSYQRGWLHSKARTITHFPEYNQNVVINHAITHGPFSALGWAHIDSIIDFGEQAIFNSFLGYASQLKISSTIGYLGATHIHLQSPAFAKKSPNQPDQTIDWGGFEAAFDINKARVDYHIQVPYLSLKQPKDSFKFQNLTFNGTTHLPDPEDKQASYWQSQGRLEVQDFLIDHNKGSTSTKGKLNWQFKTQLDQQQLLRFKHQFELTDAQFVRPQFQAPLKINDAVFSVDVEGLNPKPLTELSQQLQFLRQQMLLEPEHIDNQLMKRLERALRQQIIARAPEILTPSTAITIKLKPFNSPSGQAQFQAKASFATDFSKNTYQPLILSQLQALSVHIQAFMDAALVKDIAPEQRAYLMHLQQQGIVEQANNRYQLKAQLKNQGLRINGRSVDHLPQKPLSN